jgi:hypothetical protein
MNEAEIGPSPALRPTGNPRLARLPENMRSMRQAQI